MSRKHPFVTTHLHHYFHMSVVEKQVSCAMQVAHDSHPTSQEAGLQVHHLGAWGKALCIYKHSMDNKQFGE